MTEEEQQGKEAQIAAEFTGGKSRLHIAKWGFFQVAESFR